MLSIQHLERFSPGELQVDTATLAGDRSDITQINNTIQYMRVLAYQENREELPFIIDAYEALLMAQTQYLDTMRKYFRMMVEYEEQLEK